MSNMRLETGLDSWLWHHASRYNNLLCFTELSAESVAFIISHGYIKVEFERY